MTTLLIKADIPRKRARLEGTIAAGEHVAVTIKDLGSLASSKTLNLRVMYGPRTIAQFPAPGTQDEWEASGGDLVCKLNLNTVQAKRECGSFPENECLFVLEEVGSTVEGEEEDPTLYFVAQKDVMGWPKNHFGEPPYDLDKFPGLVRAWTAQMLVWSGYMEKWGISAVKIGGVVTISITDRYGAVTQVQVKDGRDGVDGQDGVQIEEVNEIVEGAVSALSESVNEKLEQKQDTLIAGANITINNGVISASGGGGGGSGGVPILTLATPAQNAIKKDGETVLFAALRELHLAGAVLQYDGANYYPHYHSGTELMWDCTGTMSGKVQTRRVHAVKSGETDNYTVSASARTPLAPEDHHHTSGDIDDLGAAVANIGAEQFAAKSHTHSSGEIDGLDTAVGLYGSLYFAPATHMHMSSDVTDFAAKIRYTLEQGAQSDGFIELAANRTKYVLLGGESFGGAVSILISNDEIAGRVTDSVLVVMADRDTTVTYDTLGGYVTWLAPDADGVKTIKANTPTMLYFTQIRQHSSTESAVYVVGKAELQEVA